MPGPVQNLRHGGNSILCVILQVLQIEQLGCAGGEGCVLGPPGLPPLPPSRGPTGVLALRTWKALCPKPQLL